MVAILPRTAYTAPDGPSERLRAITTDAG
jgi:hypothetical protein